MRLPKTVRVGHHRYVVSGWTHVSSQCFAAGTCQNHSLEIQINTDQAEAQVAETLIHEMLHAACHVGKVGLSDIDEERVVNQLSPILLQMMLDNWPVFVAMRNSCNGKRT